MSVFRSQGLGEAVSKCWMWRQRSISCVSAPTHHQVQTETRYFNSLIFKIYSQYFDGETPPHRLDYNFEIVYKTIKWVKVFSLTYSERNNKKLRMAITIRWWVWLSILSSLYMKWHLTIGSWEKSSVFSLSFFSLDFERGKVKDRNKLRGNWKFLASNHFLQFPNWRLSLLIILIWIFLKPNLIHAIISYDDLRFVQQFFM